MEIAINLKHEFQELINFFTNSIKIHTHGIDLVRNEDDGKFYLFDCNYASSYSDSFKDLSMYRKFWIDSGVL